MGKQNFIRSNDKATIEQLKKLGYTLLEESNGFATFINDINKKTDFDHKKVAYTNVLAMSKP